MRRTLSALLTVAALGGCGDKNSIEQKDPLYIPAECVELKSLSQTYDGYFLLLCTDSNKKEVVYTVTKGGNGWEKQFVERYVPPSK